MNLQESVNKKKRWAIFIVSANWGWAVTVRVKVKQMTQTHQILSKGLI